MEQFECFFCEVYTMADADAIRFWQIFTVVVSLAFPSAYLLSYGEQRPIPWGDGEAIALPMSPEVGAVAVLFTSVNLILELTVELHLWKVIIGGAPTSDAVIDMLRLLCLLVNVLGWIGFITLFAHKTHFPSTAFRSKSFCSECSAACR